MKTINFKNEKKTILIIEDEEINREILSNMLSDNYDLLFAFDGEEALNKIKNNKDELSLILLDLILPKMNGIELLKIIKKDVELEKIPVIIMTSDSKSEEETLNLGAVDFIPKPYPRVGIVLARIRRIIELFEDRQIINYTERDSLTKLYNKEYFYRYIEMIDHNYKAVSMDAFIVDISHFHIINERFGSKIGDSVLITLAKKLRDIIGNIGGIVCRKEADTFYVYSPHIDDYKKLLNDILDDLFTGELSQISARLKIGAYQNVDKSINISTRFDHAQMALNSIHNNVVDNIASYDIKLHDKEIFNEQLIDDFDKAIAENEFLVYYQPKFNIQNEKEYITSAEALVRWNHKKLGLISPGIFIPLFEDNGLIQKLDNYVWNSVAKQLKKWKDIYNKILPVSVNVSRIDIFDPNLINKFENIIKENELDHNDLILEITESAYTSNAELIISRVDELKKLGFCIEMDDFGTGYSSLNMISKLPIDVLKLDMSLIRQAFNEKKDTKILELIIDLAKHLGFKVVAEGVETKEQLEALKELGCDIVQGYYFSKPIPSSEFEKYLIGD